MNFVTVALVLAFLVSADTVSGAPLLHKVLRSHDAYADEKRRKELDAGCRSCFRPAVVLLRRSRHVKCSLLIEVLVDILVRSLKLQVEVA